MTSNQREVTYSIPARYSGEEKDSQPANAKTRFQLQADRDIQELSMRDALNSGSHLGNPSSLVDQLHLVYDKLTPKSQNTFGCDTPTYMQRVRYIARAIKEPSNRVGKKSSKISPMR